VNACAACKGRGQVPKELAFGTFEADDYGLVEVTCSKCNGAGSEPAERPPLANELRATRARIEREHPARECRPELCDWCTAAVCLRRLERELVQQRAHVQTELAPPQEESGAGEQAERPEPHR